MQLTLERFEQSESAWRQAVKEHLDAEELYSQLASQQPTGSWTIVQRGRSFTFCRMKHEYWEDGSKNCLEKSGRDETEEASYRACENMLQAIDDLVAAPAPDLNAAVRKIEIVRTYDRGFVDFDSILADLRRLGGDA